MKPRYHAHWNECIITYTSWSLHVSNHTSTQFSRISARAMQLIPKISCIDCIFLGWLNYKMFHCYPLFWETVLEGMGHISILKAQESFCCYFGKRTVLTLTDKLWDSLLVLSRKVFFQKSKVQLINQIISWYKQDLSRNVMAHHLCWVKSLFLSPYTDIVSRFSAPQICFSQKISWDCCKLEKVVNTFRIYF